MTIVIIKLASLYRSFISFVHFIRAMKFTLFVGCFRIEFSIWEISFFHAIFQIVLIWSFFQEFSFTITL